MPFPTDQDVQGSIPDSAVGFFLAENYFTVSTDLLCVSVSFVHVQSCVFSEEARALY